MNLKHMVYIKVIFLILPPLNNGSILDGEYIHNTFIIGLYSHHIRQRLLESDRPTLAESVSLCSRKLTLAGRILLSNCLGWVCFQTRQKPPSVASILGSEIIKTSLAVINLTCYCCGGKKHSRMKCPA